MNLTRHSKEIKIIIIFFVILMIILTAILIHQNKDTSKISEAQKRTLFESVDKNRTVNVSKYSVYGTHFNLEGTIDIVKISGIKINYVDLALKNLNGDEIGIETDYNYSDNLLTFSTYDKLNNSIDLENLELNNYYVFLKVTFSNSDIKYYSLSNSSQYQDITYYSITKHSTNNKIDIGFNQYEETPYLSMNIINVDQLPDDVYDIAIDPGHGGKDKGAINNDYTEAELALKCSISLKSKLEDLGLKVFISRDGVESANEDMANNMYSDNGRINILNESHAKLMISLHIKDDIYNKKIGGVEVYAPNDCNLDFASTLAKNIVDTSNTNYSELNSFKKLDGVYVRNFTNTDILAYESRAKKAGYEPYNINTSTPYLYIIREIGGINTNAYVDGRNKSFGANKYYNSNYGIEGYKVYLGYMDIEQDLNNIVANYSSYADGICNAIKEFYKL